MRHFGIPSWPIIPKRSTTVLLITNPGRFGPGSFRPGSFRPGSFRPILGWVVSALVGGSFRPIFEVSRFGPWSFRPKSIETIKV